MNDANSSTMRLKKNQLISFRILSRVADGMNIRAAIDEVLGAGTTARVIDEVYSALRVRS